MDSPTPAVDQPRVPAVAGMSQAERIGRVADWMLAGLRPSALAAEWTRAGWGELKPRDVSRILDQAQRLIEADARIRPTAEEAMQFVRLRDLYTRALEIQDHKTALRIHREIGIALARARAAQDLTNLDAE